MARAAPARCERDDAAPARRSSTTSPSPMSARSGFCRLWAVVAVLWIGFCVAAGSRLGYRAVHVKYCLRDGGACQEGYPPGYESESIFWRERDFVEGRQDFLEGRNKYPPSLPRLYTGAAERDILQGWSTREEVEVPAHFLEHARARRPPWDRRRGAALRRRGR